MNTNDMLQHLFDEHRSKVQQELDDMTLFDEHKDMKNSIARINEYLRGIEALLMTRSNLGVEDSMYIPETPASPRIEKTYVFERKLRGGVIRVNGEDYYIPEQMVQDMAIDQGDELRILDKTQLPEGKVRYALDVVERYGQQHPNRVMLSGQTFLEGTVLRVHDPETNLNVRITQKDETRYQLKEGDTVVLAYYTNNSEVSAVFSKENSDDLFRLLYVMPKGTHYMERCDNIPPYFEKATRFHGTESPMTTNTLERQHNVLLVFQDGNHKPFTPEVNELISRFSEEGKPTFILPEGHFPEPKHIHQKIHLMKSASSDL